jgi:hypothetical protein
MSGGPAPNSSTVRTTSASTCAATVVEPTPSVTPSYRKGAFKLFVAILLAAGSFWCVAARTDRFKESQAAAARQQAAAAQEKNPSPPLNIDKAAPGMKETNDLLINWAIAVLGATLGIAILAKGAKIRDGNWGLALFPSSWTFLWASLREGYEFKASLTYQAAKGDLKFPELNLPLYLQLEFFRSALLVLCIVGLWYLFFRFSLAEDKSKGGD